MSRGPDAPVPPPSGRKVPSVWVGLAGLLAGAAACVLAASTGWPGIAVAAVMQLAMAAYLLRAASWPPAETPPPTSDPTPREVASSARAGPAS